MSDKEQGVSQYFYVIPFDPFHVGLKGAFVETFLDFDDCDEAIEIAKHWDKFLNGEEV